MLNQDQRTIKWQPFNSVISSKFIINSIMEEKNKIQKPILSDEQINKLEKKIISAYYSQEELTIKYFTNGKVIKTTSKIKKIDFTFHKIYLKTNVIHFEQILEC